MLWADRGDVARATEAVLVAVTTLRDTTGRRVQCRVVDEAMLHKQVLALIATHVSPTDEVVAVAIEGNCSVTGFGAEAQMFPSDGGKEYWERKRAAG